ncbi:hypothetical protein EDD29_4752 [Actinocorallia herbida]|uniref:Uncharacterized protein n=1 Tax=Actinocorallia herbida TaxID=58109 RepID=A0A3N1D0V7_9ACTN|nr:hypothetical protein [Actinocorallia herbida]ROO87159.1 hypothetical protein EDD29_4752 [Actinocorallia herbida]
MSGIERRLLLIFRGSPTQAQLDRLRQALDLHPHGRLTDAEDAHFGDRDFAIADVPAVMGLWRSDDDLWSISIDADSEAILAENDIARWHSAVEVAAEDAGWILLERRSFPGTRP